MYPILLTLKTIKRRAGLGRLGCTEGHQKGAEMGIINQIAEYTRLCRALSELPRNAESPEAYEPIAKRRCELLEQIAASRKELVERKVLRS